jgi:hypothetical protein
MKTTETIDRLFLELSQFTNATTLKELHYQRELQRIVDEPHADSMTDAMKLKLMAKEALKNAPKPA